MNKAQAQRTLNQLRKTVEHRERQLAEVKRDERRGKADEREVMFAESELDLAEDDLRIFMEDVAQPLGLTRFASSGATSWNEKTAALISGKSFMLVGDNPSTGATDILVEGLGPKGSSFDERRAVREGYTNVRLVPEGSRLAKNLPKNVERYVKEHKEQGNDEAKSWALAWSRYCEYKYPNSPHCKQDVYFPGRKKKKKN